MPSLVRDEPCPNLVLNHVIVKSRGKYTCILTDNHPGKVSPEKNSGEEFPSRRRRNQLTAASQFGPYGRAYPYIFPSSPNSSLKSRLDCFRNVFQGRVKVFPVLTNHH